MLERVKWFRTPAEKDQGKVKAYGTVVQINVLEKLPEAMALIMGDDGNFIEKPISLIQMVDYKEHAIFELEQQLAAANEVIEELKLKLVKPTVKPVKAVIVPKAVSKGVDKLK